MPNAYVAGTNTSLGTEFDDGVRVGPVLERNYAATNAITGLPNPTLPSTPVPGNYDQWGPGMLNSAKNTYNIIPRGPSIVGNVVAPVTGAVTTLTLSGDAYVATRYNASTSLPATLTNVSSVIPALQLDWPRALSVTISTADFTAPGNLTMFGYDYYGYPMQESVLIGAQNTYQMNKAFYVITGGYLNATPNGASVLSVQTTDTLGLPYRVKSAGDIDSIRWGNASDLGTSQSMTGYTIADMGTSTTAANTFTVQTPYVQANSIIQLTLAGGTATGVLSVGNIVAGTSFVINNTVAASVVNWVVFNPPATQGVSAALSGGSVFIPTTAVRSDSVIQLTMATFGTASGAWTVSRILAGVGFYVSSSASTETSTIFWAIMPSNFLSGISAPLVPTGGGSVVTVSAPSVAANSKILLTYQTLGGTPGVLSVPNAGITAGTSFQIKSSSATDAGIVTWTIITPPPGFITGTANLAGGTVTVANVNVDSTVLVTYNTLSTPGTYLRVTPTNGVNFVIQSSNGGDVSTVNYAIIPQAYQTNITTYPLGVFMPADDTVATNTTGDVRGTYKPSTAANGYNVLHFSAFVSGFDNFIDQQAAVPLPGGGTPTTITANPQNGQRQTTIIDDQVGVAQYYTGVFA